MLAAAPFQAFLYKTIEIITAALFSGDIIT